MHRLFPAESDAGRHQRDGHGHRSPEWVMAVRNAGRTRRTSTARWSMRRLCLSPTPSIWWSVTRCRTTYRPGAVRARGRAGAQARPGRSPSPRAHGRGRRRARCHGRPGGHHPGDQPPPLREKGPKTQAQLDESSHAAALRRWSNLHTFDPDELGADVLRRRCHRGNHGVREFTASGFSWPVHLRSGGQGRRALGELGRVRLPHVGRARPTRRAVFRRVVPKKYFWQRLGHRGEAC